MHRYIESYRCDSQTATRAAIDLGQVSDLVEVVDVLDRRLVASIKSAAVVASLLDAWRRALQLFDGPCVDLH